jgi:hypothetical protein
MQRRLSFLGFAFFFVLFRDLGWAEGGRGRDRERERERERWRDGEMEEGIELM